MTLNKQLISTIILATMLSGCASTMSNKSTQEEERKPVVTKGSVEHFAIGALIAAPLAFAIPIVVMVVAA